MHGALLRVRGQLAASHVSNFNDRKRRILMGAGKITNKQLEILNYIKDELC